MYNRVSTGVVVAVSCVAVTGAVALIADVAEAGGNSGVSGRAREREKGFISESDKVGVRGRFGQAGESRLSARKDAHPQLRFAAEGGCQTLAPEPWFTVVRRLPDCVPVRFDENAGTYDINGDGQLEWLSMPSSADAQSESCGVLRILRSVVAGQIAFQRTCVMDMTIVRDFIDEEIPGSEFYGIEAFAFIDVDLDGDLDAVLTPFVFDPQAGQLILLACWVENTGFEAAPPRVADINRDGNVDAADLSLLLADWG